MALDKKHALYQKTYLGHTCSGVVDSIPLKENQSVQLNNCMFIKSELRLCI